MMIKTGKHIDANGKIYLPYLHEWKHVSLSFFFGSCLRTIFESSYYPYNIICYGLFVVAHQTSLCFSICYSLSQTSMV